MRLAPRYGETLPVWQSKGRPHLAAYGCSSVLADGTFRGITPSTSIRYGISQARRAELLLTFTVRLCLMQRTTSDGRQLLSEKGSGVVNSACALPVLPVTRKDSGPVAPDEIMAHRPVQQPAAVWPLISHLDLAALPTAVACARMHAREIALEWGLTALADNIELIVSELFTNGVRATEHLRNRGLTTAVVRLSLASDLQCVLIRVRDGSSQMPERLDARPDDESGRGLMLVSYLSREWGAYRKANGKVVWVIVNVEPSS